MEAVPQRHKKLISFLHNIQAETSCDPNIIIDSKAFDFNSAPRLLGVYLDHSLCMYNHVDVVVERIRKMLKMLGAISNSEWGWRKYDLKKVYLAQFKTVIDYSGSGWQLWLSESQLLRPERVQREALRMITGHSKTSPLDCMRLELGVPSIRALIKAN